MASLLRILKSVFAFLFHAITDPLELVRTGDQVYKSRFMNLWEKTQLFNRFNKGICVDGKNKLSLKNSLTHFLVHGGTGWGKTSSIIIPTILQTASSCIVIDLDGEIFKKTAGHKKSQGFHIQTLNFADISRSAQYNPLALCQTDADRKNLAEILIQTAYPDSYGESLFWNQGAASVLYILLRLLKTQAEPYQNLANLLHLINWFPKLEDFVKEYAQADVWTDYIGFMGSDEKVRGAHLATARVALDKVAQADVVALTANNTLCFQSLIQPKSIFYLIVPEVKLPFYSFLLSLFFTQLFEYVQLHKPAKPVLFLLDEFAQYLIPNFPVLITTLRRYNCSFTLIIQDMKQIIARYGEAHTSTITDGGCKTKLFFPGMSNEVAEMLSRRSGQKTVLSDFEGQKHTYHRELLTPSELIQMKDNQVLLLYGNQPPLIPKVCPYFRQRSLWKKTRIAPPEMAVKTLAPPSYLEFPNSLSEAA